MSTLIAAFEILNQGIPNWSVISWILSTEYQGERFIDLTITSIGSAKFLNSHLGFFFFYKLLTPLSIEDTDISP